MQTKILADFQICISVPLIGNEKILCSPRRSDIKEARNIDKANGKYFNSILQAFVSFNW